MAHRAGISVSVRGRLGNERPRQRDAEEPFRLLLVADFSGRLERGTPPLTRPRRVDVGAIDDLFASFAAELRVPTPDGSLDVYRPRSLEDLHPDALVANLPGLATAYGILRALKAPRVPAEALAEARAYLARGLAAPPALDEKPSPERPKETSDTATLDRLLGRAPSVEAPAEKAANPLSALLEDAVRAHKVDAPSAERDLLTSELERILTRTLREVLHTPAFRSLEASWRGADRVIRALGTDEALEIALFDVSLPEVVAAFAGAADPESTELHRLLVSNGTGWTMIAAALAFGSTDAELTALAGLGALSARAGGALLADASPELMNCSTPGELVQPRVWAEEPPSPLFHALRESPLANRIGLVCPRLLARPAYGKKSEPLESLPFEEFPESNVDAGPRAWSSGAFGVAELVGRAFRDTGWGFSDDIALSLSDLPCETVQRDGERVLLPPAEVFLDQRAADALLSRGVMPFLARRDEASLRLSRFTSIAEPPAPLVGLDSDA